MVCKPGWHHTKETREKMSATRMGRKQPLWVRRKISESQSLEKHWNWQGGISFDSYLSYPALQVKVRDSFTCQRCKREGDGRFLHVHHIDYDKYNNELSNLVTLCNACHGVTNSNRDYWRGYFQGLLEGGSQ